MASVSWTNHLLNPDSTCHMVHELLHPSRNIPQAVIRYDSYHRDASLLPRDSHGHHQSRPCTPLVLPSILRHPPLHWNGSHAPPLLPRQASPSLRLRSLTPI